MWPDEIFQSLEQAHRLVFGYGMVPWEYVAGLRSYLVPLFLAAVLFPFKYLSRDGSLAYATTVRMVLCLLSASLIVFAYQYAKTFGSRLAGLTAAFMIAFWYEFVYFAPKALGDTLAVYLIFPAVLLAERGLRDRRQNDLLWAGALLALGGMVRYQNLPLLLIPLVMAWPYGYELADLRLFKYYLAAALLVLISAGALDWLIWGEPFHSLLYTFNYHLLQGGAANYGVMPWHWYGQVLWQTQGFLWPVLLVFALLAIPRAKVLWATLVFYFIFYSLIPHKEYRFIFLCLPLLMTAAALGAGELSRKISGPFLRRATLAAAGLALTLASIYGGINFRWETMGYNSRIIDQRQSAWTVMRAHILAYQYLSTRPDLRGLWDNVDNWRWSPGYYYLHKNIPLYFTPQVESAVRGGRRGDYLISRALLAGNSWEKVAQMADVCVYRFR